MADVLLISMSPREVQCYYCRVWCECKWGIPTFNGDIVSNDFPDERWSAGGGNVAVCLQCYTKHATGKMQTRDSWYIRKDGE